MAFPSFPSQKPIATTSTAQASTPTGPPLPLLLLRRLPRLMLRAPPCPRVGTASSAVSWPPRLPCVCPCLTTPIGTAGTRRSAGSWHRRPMVSPPTTAAVSRFRWRRRPHQDMSHVARVFFKCLRCFRDMLQVFRMDVAYVVIVVHVCCRRLFLMFHLFFDICCKCVYLDVHMFHIYVASVLSRCRGCLQ
jgi:hypothetical protein